MKRVCKHNKRTREAVRHICVAVSFCFLPTVIFVLGSMAGMNFILHGRENKLLQESGTEVVESPVAVWQEPQDAGTEETDANSGNGMPLLTVAQMEEVINYRGDAVSEVLHDPVTGQISMEEAIACGERWLAEMGYTEENTEGTPRTQARGRRAALGVKKDQKTSKVPMEPYYSFWTVGFSDESVYASLSVNAVTGRVWDAEVLLYDDMSQKFSWETLDLFAKLAGVQADMEDFIEINATNTGAILAIKDSCLYAQVRYYDIETVVADRESWSAGVDGEYYETVTDDIKIAEYYRGGGIRRQRLIEYHLVTFESDQPSS